MASETSRSDSIGKCRCTEASDEEVLGKGETIIHYAASMVGEESDRAV